MARYLKAVGAIGGSRVYKTITPVDELWVTLDLTFDNDTTGADFVQLWDPTVGTSVQGVKHSSLPAWQEDQQLFIDQPVPAGKTLGTLQTVEVHHKKSDVAEAWVDGISLWSSPETTGLQVGEVDIGGGTDFITNVKIGTTRGGSEIFSDDFSSGDLSAWDGSYGNVSVVSQVITEQLASSIQVNVAFNDSALEVNPTFTQLANEPYRISDGFTIDRGRSSEIEQTSTGTAKVRFRDLEGIIDPTNSGGPFFGLIDPMRQIQIWLLNPVDGTWHSLFRGHVGEWLYDVDISGVLTRVSAECEDLFGLLAALEMTPGHHGDTSPALSQGDIYFGEGPAGPLGFDGRLNKAADDAGLPDAWRNFFTGNITLQASIYQRLDQILSVFFDAADAEFPGLANVYVDRAGRLTFHGRYARFQPDDYGLPIWQVANESIALADPDNLTAPFYALSFRRSKADLVNASMCLPQIPNGGDYTLDELDDALIKDDTSIDKYGWRSRSFENLLTLSARTTPATTDMTVSGFNEGKKYAQFFVENGKNSHTRVTSIQFRSVGTDNPLAPPLWDLLTKIDISHRIELTTEHPGGGGFESETFYVEGVHYNAQPMRGDIEDVVLDVDLSPASYYSFDPFVS